MWMEFQYGCERFLAGGSENFVWVDLLTKTNLFGQHLITGGWVVTAPYYNLKVINFSYQCIWQLLLP